MGETHSMRWSTSSRILFFVGPRGDIRQRNVVYLEVLGNSIVVLNSMEAIGDLLERRAWNYSHRPTFTMVGELMGLDRTIGLNNRDKVWRQQRKLASIALSPQGIKLYMPLQERLAAVLLSELEETPDKFAGLCELTVARLILEITYGISVQNMDNSYIAEAEKVFELVRRSIRPGAYLVDFIPWLKHVPAWVPFSSQTYAARARAQIETFVDRPYQYAKGEMEASSTKPSLVATLLSNKSHVEGLDFEEIVKWTAGTMYDANLVLETAVTLKSFILAMVLHPEVQTRAQKELDLLLNGTRLPTVEDRASLPYVNACMKEILRWHVALPLGMPRGVDQDDVYNGYLIPKGSIILPNARSIAGEGNYLRFMPEAHLNGAADDTPDPLSYAFGFSRRACPGRLLAENSVFIFIASILTVFNISPEVDSAGNEMPLHPKFQTGLMSHPEPFKCQIVVRSEATKTLLANQLLGGSNSEEKGSSFGVAKD
ncbi:cytochrome P450 [Mycena galopus ATCC 62051]|nr:cytochrome P450 [Mycena galopus ATCC 62051]